MLLRPGLLLLLDPYLVKAVSSSWCMRILANLRLGALLLDRSEFLLDLALDPSFLPGFTAGGFFLRAFVGLPAAFWEDPAFAGGALDQQDVGAVCRERDNASYEAFAIFTISRTPR